MSETVKTIILDKRYQAYDQKFAHPKKALLSMTIDFFFANFVGIVVGKIVELSLEGQVHLFTQGRLAFYAYLITLLHIPILSSVSQTLGQRIAKIKVSPLEGTRFHPLKSIIRWLCSLVSLTGYASTPVPWFDRKFDVALIDISRSS